jgi:HEAT repeat protein
MLVGLLLCATVTSADAPTRPARRLSADGEPVRKVLERMRAQAGRLTPEARAELHKLGPEGLSAVLDELLPGTAEDAASVVTEAAATALIRQLGSVRYARREAATAKLIRWGRFPRTQVPFLHERLEQATRGEDPEVAVRARSVLRAWGRREQDYVVRWADALAVYVRGLHDPDRLDLLARRAAVALRLGRPSGGRERLLEAMVARIAAAGKDRYCDLLRPTLAHSDRDLPLWLFERMRPHLPPGFVPRLFLDALVSHRRPLADDVLGRLEAPPIDRLAALLRTSSGQAAVYVVRALGLSLDPRALAPLTAALKHKEAEVRWIAALALARHSDPGAVEPLIAALRDSDAKVVAAAARTLGMYADWRAVLPLIAALGHSESRVRAAAADALGRTGDRRAIRPLRGVLAADAAKIITVAFSSAARALAALGAPPTERLAARAGRARDGYDRALAVKLLAEIAHHDPRAVEHLVAALKDPEQRVVWPAVEALAKLGDLRAIGPLVKMLNAGRLQSQRRAAAMWLGQLGGERAVGALKGAGQGVGLPMRLAVAWALLRSGDAPAARAVLAEAAVQVRWRGAGDLEQVLTTGPPAARLLAEVLNQDDRYARSAALWPFVQSRFAAAAAADRLLVLLEGADPKLQRDLATALGRSGDPRAVGPLALLLNVGDYGVAHVAGMGLARIGGPKAIAALKKAMSEGTNRARHSAVAALGERADLASVNVLLEALEAGEQRLYASVVAALGRSGDPRAVKPLVKAFEKGDRHVGEFVEALGLLGGRQSAAVMLKALQAGRLTHGGGRSAARVLALMDEAPTAALIDALGKVGGAVAGGRSDDGRRVALLVALGLVGDRRAVGPVAAVLQASRSSTVCKAAIDALGDLGDPSASGPLLDVIKNDQAIGLRQQAAIALGRIGGPKAINALIEVFEGPDEGLRALAVRGLARWPDRAALGPLRSALDDARPEVFESAAEALGRIGDPAAVEALERTARRMRESQRRIAAVHALGRIPHDTATEALARCAHGSTPEVSLPAAAALARRGDPRGVRVLLQGLVLWPSMQRIAAARILATIEAEGLDAALLRLLRIPASYVYPEVAGALGLRRMAAAVPVLIRCLGPPSQTSLRAAAARALGRIGDRAALVPLSRLLLDPDVPIRAAAAEALGRLGGAEAVEPLAAACRDHDPVVRRAAIRALATVGGQAAADALCRFLDTGFLGGVVAQEAAWAMLRLNDPRGIPLLAETVRDMDLFAMSHWLGRSGQQRPMDALRAALVDPSWRVRCDAVTVARKLGAPGLPMLLAAAEDRHWKVRHHAIESLGRATDPAAIPAVRKALDDRDPDIRGIAQYALKRLRGY